MAIKKDLLLLTKPYYWVNILLSLSFIIAKRAPYVCSRLLPIDKDGECELDSRETSILFFLIIVIMMRTRKTGSVTMINYLTSSFLYTKGANLLLWFFNDPRYGVGFAAVCILCAMLLPEPTYSGPEHVTYFRTRNGPDDELERDKNVAWLVTFYTVWNPACVNFAPVFAELSTEYNLPNLRFGKVDIGRYPESGKKYHVSDSSFSRQLPTLILFRNGKEVMRRPHADGKGKLVKFFFGEDNIRAAFDLNNLYKECKENPLAVVPTTAKKWAKAEATTKDAGSKKKN